MNYWIQIVSLVFLIGGLVADDCTKTVCRLADSSIRFFLLGDWGGLPVWPWYTHNEATVAATMGSMAQSINSHFQVALGDNFYLLGVTNAEDSRFKNTFEDIYTANALKNTPWYVLAGNHDHYGNVSGEIAYSAKSARWKFPSLNYTVRYALTDGTEVDIVMIDTVTLCGNTLDEKPTSIFNYLWKANPKEPTGPADPQAAEAQWQWLENQLQTSNAKYLFVAGHFPVYSVAEHGPTSCLVKQLLPLMTRYRVSAYFSGHDHCLQHLKYTTNGWTNNFVLSGAGGYMSDDMTHQKEVPSGSLQFHYPDNDHFIGPIGFGDGGFVKAQVSSISAVFTYYKGTGEQLYQFSTGPRN